MGLSIRASMQLKLLDLIMTAILPAKLLCFLALFLHDLSLLNHSANIFLLITWCLHCPSRTVFVGSRMLTLI